MTKAQFGFATLGLIAAVLVAGCSGAPPDASATAVGYTIVQPGQERGRDPYQCGGVDVPPLERARINGRLSAEQVSGVTVCHNPRKARFTTYRTPAHPAWDTADGPVATTAQVQALLAVLATPDEIEPLPNSCTAVGVIPADPLYLTLTDGTRLQPMIPVDRCDREIEAARRTIDAFPNIP